MARTLFPSGVLVCVLQGLVVPLASADEDDAKPIKMREPTQFIRVQEDEFKSPVALQTATARYVLKDDQGNVRVEVFLESAVHIGDAAYYRGFNKRFEHYDAVLYELIAAPEERVPDADNGTPHPAKLVQEIIGDSLGFKHQVDQINYEAANMVHSDLSPDELRKARLKRGDDQFVELAEMMIQLMREVDEEPGGEVLSLDVLSDPDGGIKLRRMMAQAFGDGDSAYASLRPSQVRSLISDRNAYAMKVFQKQLDQGRRKIAFFWGANHMPDFERQLVLGYGFQPDGVLWRNAWDLREGAIERAPLESVLEKTLRSVLNDALDDLFERP